MTVKALLESLVVSSDKSDRDSFTRTACLCRSALQIEPKKIISEGPLRFVILEHETPVNYPRGRHWDFMVEQAGGLRTWALERPPAGGQSTNAEPLPLHRIEYLDYEGDLSGNRGQVHRWDYGPCTIEQDLESALQLRLQGQRLQGVARIERSPSETQRWTFSFVSDSD